MLLGLNIIDKTKEEYLKDIADVVNHPKTLIFIDTNILAYMYKLHNEAREEFFSWVQQLTDQGRIFVPAWAAAEYFNRVKSKKLGTYTPQSKDSEQIQKNLERLLDSANLFLDEQILRSIGYSDSKPKFLKDFQIAVSNIRQYTPIFKHQFEPTVVHEQIQTHFTDIVLKSNLAELSARAFGEGEMRNTHRIPPGFKDDTKGDNKFGDLIIWYEILAFANKRKADFNNVVFLTNDEKIDWVYAPQHRKRLVGPDRKTIANKDPIIKLVDPQLKLEFYQEVEHDNFQITTLDILIESLSISGRSTDFAQLAAAIQINLDLGGESASADATSSSEHSVGVDSNEQIPQTEDVVNESSVATIELDVRQVSETSDVALIYEETALKDSIYDDSTDNWINNIIQRLKSHNWYIQNPATSEVERFDFNQSFSNEAWFVLGRNIYQSACGNAQKAMNFMINLERRLNNFPHDVAEHVLAGMVYEIYFDSNGEFRTSWKSSFLETPLQLITFEKYSKVLTFIQEKLSPNYQRLLFIPNQSEMIEVTLTVSESIVDDSVIKSIESIKVNGIELLREVDDPVLDWLMKRSHLRVSDIVQKISRELSIPKWAIRYSPEIYDLQDTFRVPENLVFDISLAKNRH